MPVNCVVILRWDATPEQLSALGAALWRWCVRTAGDRGLYQYLDDQPLADLIAGTLPRRVMAQYRKGAPDGHTQSTGRGTTLRGVGGERKKTVGWPAHA